MHSQLAWLASRCGATNAGYISVCEGGLPISGEAPQRWSGQCRTSRILTDREIIGANALTGVLIFLTAVLAVAFLAGTSPDMRQSTRWRMSPRSAPSRRRRKTMRITAERRYVGGAELSLRRRRLPAPRRGPKVARCGRQTRSLVCVVQRNAAMHAMGQEQRAVAFEIGARRPECSGRRTRRRIAAPASDADCDSPARRGWLTPCRPRRRPCRTARTGGNRASVSGDRNCSMKLSSR